MAWSRHTICKNFIQQGQNRQIISCTWFVPLVFLQRLCLGWSTPRPISFSKGPDCKIILFSECAIRCIPWFSTLAYYSYDRNRFRLFCHVHCLLVCLSGYKVSEKCQDLISIWSKLYECKVWNAIPKILDFIIVHSIKTYYVR